MLNPKTTKLGKSIFMVSLYEEYQKRWNETISKLKHIDEKNGKKEI